MVDVRTPLIRRYQLAYLETGYMLKHGEKIYLCVVIRVINLSLWSNVNRTTIKISKETKGPSYGNGGRDVTVDTYGNLDIFQSRESSTMNGSYQELVIYIWLTPESRIYIDNSFLENGPFPLANFTEIKHKRIC